MAYFGRIVVIKTIEFFIECKCSWMEGNGKVQTRGKNKSIEKGG